MTRVEAEEVKEILSVVSEKIPELLNSLTDILYGREQSKKYGGAVAGFYKSLKESGMMDEQAYELTKQYMSAMNLPGMLGQAMGGRGGGRGPGFAFKIKGHGEEENADEDKDDDEDE
jgi:hypothetical protein